MPTDDSEQERWSNEEAGGEDDDAIGQPWRWSDGRLADALDVSVGTLTGEDSAG